MQMESTILKPIVSGVVTATNSDAFGFTTFNKNALYTERVNTDDGVYTTDKLLTMGTAKAHRDINPG